MIQKTAKYQSCIYQMATFTAKFLGTNRTDSRIRELVMNMLDWYKDLKTSLNVLANIDVICLFAESRLYPRDAIYYLVTTGNECSSMAKHADAQTYFSTAAKLSTAIGRMYYNKEMFLDAWDYIGHAAHMGNPQAWYILGDMYLNGVGVDEDEQLAIYWLQLAASKCYPRACYDLGNILFDGDIMPQDLQRAFELYLTAVKAIEGDTSNLSKRALARFYEEGIHPVSEQNLAIAQKLLKSAAKTNRKNHLFKLAKFYDRHHNRPMALEFYRRAAAKGHTKAITKLEKSRLR